MDEEGSQQVKKGPGRVFPGPYDVFRTQESTDRSYFAYHLRPDRGLLLRVVDDSVKKEDLARELPKGAQLDKDVYTKGDEIFIYGFDAYLIPCPSIEIIDPKTRSPHIGNNHSNVYVQSVGVDQKSGVYVANVETGNVNLIKGEKKLFLDPRKECHIKRKIPANLWNLIIGKGEPHKCVPEGSMVETPWALSVVIPNNEAVLVTSKDGRRPVVGPKTILLGYEEWLEVMKLSRGRPKDDRTALATCFLRVSGNRISDRITLETSDYVRLIIDVQYGIEFIGEKEEEQIQWFNYKDYIMFFCSSLRSRVRAMARKLSLSDLYPKMADCVRDWVLGEKPESGHRPGRLFEENNMKVTEVDVLMIEIPDDSIADSFINTNREVVLNQLRKTSEEVELEVSKHLDAIAKEKGELDKSTITRRKELDELRAETDQALTLLRMANEREQLDKIEEANDLKNKKALARRKETHELDASITQGTMELELSNREKLNVLELALVTAGAKADVLRLEAVQPDLIKAIEGMGDKQAIAELVKNLPKATGELGLLLGIGGIAGLIKMLDGTPLANSISMLKSRITIDNQ